MVEDKERLMECIGNVLAGETRILYGNRVKIIGYDHQRKGILVEYLDNREITVINRIHDIRRII
jgi:hypothetical protein